MTEEQLAALSDEDRAMLVEFYQNELKISREGVELQPPRIKISKDTLQFVDELGNTSRELRGAVVFKHTARGLWDRGDDDNKAPVCSSLNGKVGNPDERGEKLGITPGQACATCQFNQWGTGTDEAGNPTKGKACKEMRRLFFAEDGSQLPSVLTLPPTSIRRADKYFSARLNEGVVDVAQETVVTLRSERGGKFDYAVAEFALGDIIPPAKMLKLAKMRDDIQAAAERMGVSEMDYDTVDEDDDVPY